MIPPTYLSFAHFSSQPKRPGRSDGGQRVIANNITLCFDEIMCLYWPNADQVLKYAELLGEDFLHPNDVLGLETAPTTRF
jgi:cellulase/cellobiase CelA1